jgi:sporulation-control protein
MGKFLSRIGIGSAEVDTILHSDTVQPGDTIDAHVEVEGGSADQEVENIDLAVMTRYEVELDDGKSYRNEVIRTVELTDGFTIGAGEQRTFDTRSIRIPEETPPTLGKTEVWIQTGLDIDWSVDPTDEDALHVRPGPYLSTLLDAVENLGFVQNAVDNVRAPRHGPNDFAQEFEYRPQTGQYRRELDEIELFPIRKGDRLETVIEVDQRGASVFGSDESHHRTTVDSTDTEQVEHQIGTLIDGQL